ncbi:DUF7502 family protein [Methanimicrococcus blatticola]|uniref:DUF7502 family protein n=1 Tax=Methanimicrococcus blatticola TaxID=91560 RepID=UPI001061D04A|nr:hypothetical protein [Methanimicrococcus blatticola]MBZ3935052.1 hypothetical protein [Methanimicrococcus blatticola]MCC2508851.1 hypothetical protein [Methanimicrococcus blatticola]
MDLEIFTRKMDSVIRRYRTIYDLLEFLAIALITLLIAVFFNLDDIFKLIPLTEPYVGLSPDIPFFSITYETIFMFFIVCLFSLLILELTEKNVKRIYKLFKKAPPQRKKSQDIVEDTYPELKDRLKTAYDHRNADPNNFIITELKTSVSSDVEGVSTSDLIDRKRVGYSLAAIVVAGLFLGFIFFTGFTGPFSPGDIYDRFPNGTITQPPLDENTSSNNSSSIPTEAPPIAAEPGVDIDVTLPPGAGTGPGDMLEGAENNFTPSTPYPPESLSSHHFYDTLPAGYEDIIKDYFKKLAENS